MAKTIVITGGSSGFGLAIARTLAGGGARVLLAARGLAALEAAREHVEGAEIFAMDATRGEDWLALRDFARRRLGQTDVLINSAGGGGALKPLLEQSAEQLAHAVSLNLISTMLGTQTFAREMCAGGGLIVNIGSVCSRHAYRRHSAYCAAKFGVLGFSRAASLELMEKNVRVSCVMPGAVNTGFQAAAGTPPVESDLTAEDVARSVAYIVRQPENVYIEEISVWPRGRRIASL